MAVPCALRCSRREDAHHTPLLGPTRAVGRLESHVCLGDQRGTTGLHPCQAQARPRQDARSLGAEGEGARTPRGGLAPRLPFSQTASPLVPYVWTLHRCAGRTPEPASGEPARVQGLSRKSTLTADPAALLTRTRDRSQLASRVPDVPSARRPGHRGLSPPSPPRLVPTQVQGDEIHPQQVRGLLRPHFMLS